MGLFDHIMELRSIFILYLTVSSSYQNSHFKNTMLLQTQIKSYFIKNALMMALMKMALMKGVLCLFVFRSCFRSRLIRKYEM